jgi:peptidoglycan hydrolase CwlO-like protein
MEEPTWSNERLSTKAVTWALFVILLGVIGVLYSNMQAQISSNVEKIEILKQQQYDFQGDVIRIQQQLYTIQELLERIEKRIDKE